MNIMSGDIKLTKQDIDINTMSGNVTLFKCYGNVNTMSGDINLTNHQGKNVNSMSGDVTINDSDICKINTMSGDINLTHVNSNLVTSMNGDINIKYCDIMILECSELFGENSKIGTLIIRDNSDYISVNKENCGFKWWNPFTWGKTQIGGNNSTSIHSDGVMILNGKTYVNGKCITKSKHPRTFILPDTIEAKVVEFDNGRTDNILKSKYQFIVKNGKWVQWD